MTESTDKNGRRWYDSAKVVWSLLGVLATIIMIAASGLYSRLYGLETRVSTGEAQRERMEQKLDDLKSSVDRIEHKLDK